MTPKYRKYGKYGGTILISLPKRLVSEHPSSRYKYSVPVFPVLLCLLLALASPAAAQPANLAGFDADRDGKTSRVEYRLGLVSQSMKFDKNRDGRVTVAELPGFARLPGVKGAVEKVFRANDLSGDGALSPDELSSRAEVRFRELDLNADGYLDPPEIKAARRSR